MKLKFTLRILGCTLLAVLTPTVLSAQTLPYGTARKPHTCPSTVEPKKGAPSVEQAKMYFLCDQEWESPSYTNSGSFWVLISDLTLQIASHSRPANATDLTFNARQGGEHLGMDTDQPVYDIRASYTSSTCYKINQDIYREGKNCRVEQFPSSTGICFRNTFGDWHCRTRGSAKEIGKHLPPPQN